MPQFVHMDISADDPERAARFYERVFGWKITRLEGPTPYWLLTPPEGGTAPGAGIAARSAPWQGVTPTIDVASADLYADRIVKEGGTIFIPKTEIPGVGQLVTFKDTEGNVLAILEPATDSQFAAPAASPGA